MKAPIVFCLALSLLFWEFDMAEGGILISPAVKWTTFAARPTSSESTPNYYGYAGELNLVYSIGQVFYLTA